VGSWRDDGTRPRPPGPRDIPAIVEGVDELRGRGERVAFVAGLLDSGEWEMHGAALVLNLATAWGLKQATVREYAQEIRASMALNPATRAGVVASLARELDTIRKKAVKAEAYGPAVNAVMGKARVFGIVASGAAQAPRDATEGDGASGMRPVATVRCPACGVGTAADDGAPKHCGGCGKPLPPPTQPLDHEEPKEGTTP
jgi:hypothetical protein